MSQLWKGVSGETIAITRQARHVNDLSTQASKVLRSRPEGERAKLREKLIEVDQAIWEGRDPFPYYILKEGADNTKALRLKREEACSSDRFRPFYLFAPEVRQFLFPEHMVSGIVVSTQSTTKWLVDPTYKLLTHGLYTEVDDHKLFEAAEKMLLDLTDYTHDKYCRKGRGGYVLAWI